jgi:hypothetical protein
LRFNLPAIGCFIQRSKGFYDFCVAIPVLAYPGIGGSRRADFFGFSVRTLECQQSGKNLSERRGEIDFDSFHDTSSRLVGAILKRALSFPAAADLSSNRPVKREAVIADAESSTLRPGAVSVRNNDRFADFTSAAWEVGFAMMLCSSQIR